MQTMFKALLLLATYLPFACGTKAQTGALPPAQFQQQLSAIHPQLLDVRTAGEYQQGHLENVLQADWTNRAEFSERIKYLDKNKPLFVYCASGGRSGQAAEWLATQGFSQVVNLSGGIIAWKQAGLPVVSAEDTRQMSIEAYNKLIHSAAVVLVDFGAEWCPPCKKMEPILASLQKEMGKNFTLVKVDGGRDIDLMKLNGVSALPVFLVYKNGQVVYRGDGVQEKATLQKYLQ
ncbi:MAG: thioredoxin 1 [Chitinophagia bacterium]|nr:thioredoxin 1 [Chitinophagia bacterium]